MPLQFDSHHHVSNFGHVFDRETNAFPVKRQFAIPLLAWWSKTNIKLGNSFSVTTSWAEYKKSVELNLHCAVVTASVVLAVGSLPVRYRQLATRCIFKNRFVTGKGYGSLKNLFLCQHVCRKLSYANP